MRDSVWKTRLLANAIVMLAKMNFDCSDDRN